MRYRIELSKGAIKDLKKMDSALRDYFYARFEIRKNKKTFLLISPRGTTPAQRETILTN